MPIITTSDLHPWRSSSWCCDRDDCRYGCHDHQDADTDDSLDADHD